MIPAAFRFSSLPVYAATADRDSNSIRFCQPTLQAQSLPTKFETFDQSLTAYNRAARGEEPDDFHKTADEMAQLTQGPFYAVDASVDARLFPLSCMTVGGLVVDELSGAEKSVSGEIIPGLYAAGHNAVGMRSNLYVSGLSFSDCVYSSRRAARAIAEW